MRKDIKKLLYISIIVFILIIFDLIKNNIEEPEATYLSINTQEKKEQAVEEIETIRFLFFGDLMLDRYVRELISRQGIDYLLELIRKESFTDNYDYVFANLEGAVTNNGLHYPPEQLYDFAFDPETVNKLKDYNFNIFSVANNHLTDQGQKGVNETYENLNDLGFYHFGCRDGYLSPTYSYPTTNILSEDDCSLIITETKNRKIAWLGFSVVYQTINEDAILEKIRVAKENSDFVIISPHWGAEYQTKANDIQRNLARRMVEAGADLIVGHHPHVVQDYEKYQDAYIFYSLGNFIFDQYFSKETQQSLVVSIELNENGEMHKRLYKTTSNLSKIKEIINLNE